MKVVLAALNAKYIHTSLAIRYLVSSARDLAPDTTLREYNINQPVGDIAADLYGQKPALLGFACYIWNMGETLRIVNLLKKVSPELKVVLGGPEVSYDAATVLAENPAVDYVIAGEGEEPLRGLLTALQGQGDLGEVAGLAFRDGEQILRSDRPAPPADLGRISCTYDDLAELRDKIIYYECSRGCPFQCQYCLSSTFTGVRFFPLERIKQDLRRFVAAGVKQVKFVDRTFNCNRAFALEIFRFLAGQEGGTNFHFEIAADLLDEETLTFLASVAPGRFQFEIGVQSTYPPTLAIVRRETDWFKIAAAVQRLNAAGNIHLHLDLIAGLPAESYRQFGHSFNDVFALAPGRLQLGFLKLLKGSGVRERARDFGYIHTEHPPYEVLANDDISYEEILRLKGIEDLLEKYQNSHQFEAALSFALRRNTPDAFHFFEDFTAYWQERGYQRRAHGLRALYRIFAAYYEERRWPEAEVFLELLKFDFLRTERVLQLPEFFPKYELPGYRERFYRFLSNADNVRHYLPRYEGLSAREISKRVQIACFKYPVTELLANPLAEPVARTTTLLFRHEERDPLFGRARVDQIEI